MEARKLYVLGSINTDMAITSDRLPEKGETIVGRDFAQTLGGKGCNQAIAAAKLGLPTRMIGAVGTDYQGQQALQEIAKFGVETDYIARVDDAYTGTALILRIAQDNRIILDQGANGKVHVEQIKAGLNAATDKDALLMQFEIPLDIVLAGLKQARQLGMMSIVNPAPALKVDDDMLALIDIIVLNQVESQELTGIYPKTEVEAEKIAAWFFSKGIDLVVLTLGSGGSIALRTDQTIYTPAYHVDVVDTTGAGDAFIGTMLYFLHKHVALEQALQYANAAGGLVCTRKGAQTALPTLSELENFIRNQA